MPEFQKNLLLRSLLLTLLLMFACNASASSTWVQGGHAGGWVDPDQPFHGMFIEVIVDHNSPTRLSVVIAWFAYINGAQTWIIGIGNVVQNGADQVANLSAFIYEGNDFPPLYDPSQTVEITWGSMTIEFDGCDKALFTWNSSLAGYGSGEINLERLTTIADSFCNPELGTDANDPDDHGNYWQTATQFTLKNQPVFQARISGIIDYKGDVDVFMFTVYKQSDVTIATSGETDTTGNLFLLDANREIDLDSDDDSGMDENFTIEKQLEPGIYTIHVKSPNLLQTKKGRYLLTLTVINL